MNIVSKALLIPVSFISVPILTKNLSLEDYGLWGLTISAVSVIIPFSGLGLSSALSRFGPSSDNFELKRSFSTLLLFKFFTQVFFGILLLLFSDFISELFFEGNSFLIVFISILMLVTSIEPLFKRILKVKRKIIHLSSYEIWNGYFTIVIYLIVFSITSSLYTLLVSYILLKIINILILSFTIRKSISVKFWDKDIIKKYSSYGGFTAVSSICFWLINLSDRFILSYFSSSESVGVYTAAYSIGNIPRTISAAITFIFLVSLSKLYDQKQIYEVQKILSNGYLLFLFLILPICFGSILFSEELLYFFSTKVISEKGYIPLILILFGHLFLGIVTFKSYPLLLQKNTKTLAYFWLIALAINITLNLILIPMYEELGASISTFSTYFLLSIIMILNSRNNEVLKSNHLIVKKILISALIMLVFGYFYKKILIDFNVFYAITILAIFYFISSYYFGIYKININKKKINFE